MRRKFTKYTAGFIVFTMLIYTFPFEIFAKFQNPVKDLSVTDLSDINGTNHSVSLQWKRPSVSNIEDASAIDGTGTDNTRASHYDVVMRNASKSEPYNYSDPMDSIQDVTDETFNKPYENLNLEKGSLYGFKVIPYHMHKYKNPDPNNSAPISKRAPYTSPTYVEIPDTLYLTDILVTAAGEASSLTVTWDNPTLDGQQVFDGYKVYYAAYDPTLPILNGENATPVTIPADDPNIVKLPGGKFQYVFKDPENLKEGLFYSVKVEPLYKNNELRSWGSGMNTSNTNESKNVSKITVEGKTYNISYTGREYRFNRVTINPALYVQSLDRDSLKLYWNSFADKSYVVNRIDVYSSTEKEILEADPPSGRPFASIGVNNARNVNFLITEKPNKTIHYRFVAYTSNPEGSMISNIAQFDPSFKEFDPYTPTIDSITDSKTEPFSMDVTFKGFTRPPYNENEIADEQLEAFVDKNIMYQLYVADTLEALDSPNIESHAPKTVSTEDLTEIRKKNIATGKTELYYNLQGITKYINDNGGGALTVADLEANKVYYVKVVAIRSLGVQKSKPSYSSHYIAPTGDIATVPIMMNKPPLRIKKDIDGNDMITDKDISIQWDVKWYETYDSTDKTWHAKIGVKDGKVVFGDVEGARYLYLNDLYYKELEKNKSLTQARFEEKAKDALLALGASAEDILLNTLAFRFMDLSGKDFEIHVSEYDYMKEVMGTYEQYLEEINKPSNVQNTEIWKQIKKEGETRPSYTVDTVMASKEPGKIKPNTSYVIFFRPYQTVNGKKTSYNPSYLAATTLSDRPPTSIDPKSPALKPESATDTSVTVNWESSDVMKYELVWSPLLTDYPKRGKLVSPEKMITAKKSIVNGIEHSKITIEGLFPDTTYYLWIRSKNSSTGETKYSQWSNPIDIKTADILAPEPPKGLSLASKLSLEDYNKENKTLLEPKGVINKGTENEINYMVIEWMRIYADLNNKDGVKTINTPKDNKPNKEKSVIGTPLMSPSLTNSYMVQYLNLDPNTTYYYKAKAVLTVKKDDDGIRQNYNYIVQIADNDEFKDYNEVSIPPLEPLVDPLKMKRKESRWTETVHFQSSPTELAYDGNANPDMYPLPNRDFEVTYDQSSQTVKYRFRSDKIGADGLKDNQVDQRFISRLVQNKTYTYEVNFGDKNPDIKRQVVEMPYSVHEAFEQRKINLKIKSNNTVIIIVPGALATREVENISDFKKESAVEISLLSIGKNIPNIGVNQTYAAMPKELSVIVRSPSRSVNVTDFAKEIKIDLQLDNKYTKLYKNVNAYVGDRDSSGWQAIKSSYDTSKGILSFNTYKAAGFSAIATDGPVIPQMNRNLDDIYGVTNAITITDMGIYEPTKQVTANQFNNIIAAIANNETSVSMNKELSNEDFEALGKSTLLVSGSNVSNEAGISSLVKLYEIKTKTSVKDYHFIGESDSPPIINKEYQRAMLKAQALGFLDGEETDFKGDMTFSRLMNILNSIQSLTP